MAQEIDLQTSEMKFAEHYRVMRNEFLCIVKYVKRQAETGIPPPRDIQQSLIKLRLSVEDSAFQIEQQLRRHGQDDLQVVASSPESEIDMDTEMSPIYNDDCSTGES